MSIVNVRLDHIQPNPWNTRNGTPDPEYIRELAEDIAANGLLQKPAGRLVDEKSLPIKDETTYPAFNFGVVSADEFLVNRNASVQLAFGHNRLAAYVLLADYRPDGHTSSPWLEMPVDIQPFSDEQMALLAWSENEKRRDVTPIERAMAIQRRIEDFGWTQAQIADKLGISRPAVSNSLRLLRLPEEVQNAMTDGRISERVATALVSLFDLPESLQSSDRYSYYSTPEIVREALAGNLTSDGIRERVDRIVANRGVKLEKAPFALNKIFELEEIRSPTCRDCELRFKDRNVCQDPGCYKLKKEYAELDYLERAGQVCGIPPIEDLEKDYYSVTRFDHWRNEQHLDAVLKSGCSNLRLLYTREEPHELDRDRIDGFPNAKIICAKQEHNCSCKQGLEFADSAESVKSDGSAPAADELKDLARAARQEKRAAQSEARDILRETAERIATGLAMRNKATWLELLNIIFYGSSEGLNDLWDIQVKLGEKIAERSMPYQINSVNQVIEGMNKILAACELELLELPKEDLSISEDPVYVGKPMAEVFAESGE